MNSNQISPPGTVSKILWHFTGGPKWNAKTNSQQKRPKPTADAYSALISILETKQLRIGQYREVVKIQLPKLRRRNPKTHAIEELIDAVIERSSTPVCCLADIPIAHLSYHAGRYGKIAIGFNREAPVKHGFNPVFYTLSDSDVLRSLHDGFGGLEDANNEPFRWVVGDLIHRIEELECDKGHAIEGARDLSWELELGLDDINDDIAKANRQLKQFLAFVKTFRLKEFSTIYCEREWRSTKPFFFRADEIAMIVLPKRAQDRSFFAEFTNEEVTRLELPRSIPVVPWEDLVEH